MSSKNDQQWLKHGFVPIRGPGSAYESTLEKGKFHLAQMDRADFESAVNTLVQQRMKVVY